MVDIDKEQKDAQPHYLITGYIANEIRTSRKNVDAHFGSDDFRRVDGFLPVFKFL